MNRITGSHLSILSLFVLSTVLGCGGGASSDVTVTVKPKDSGAAAETAATGTSETTGGTAAAAGGIGNFKGVITYDGTAPVMDLLNSQKDAICFANKDQVKDQSLIVNPENKGIKNVFVYLNKVPKGATVAPAPSEPLLFDQKFCTFVPHTMIVRTGRPIQVVNGDNTNHNTHTYPISPRNPGFNQSVSPNDRKGIPTVFKGAERYPVTVKCDIHAWMTAYILPLDHDFVAVTDANGQFEIKGLPAGDHEFVVWHEKAGNLNKKYKVTILADQPNDQKLSFSADKFEE